MLPVKGPFLCSVAAPRFVNVFFSYDVVKLAPKNVELFSDPLAAVKKWFPGAWSI